MAVDKIGSCGFNSEESFYTEKWEDVKNWVNDILGDPYCF